ncbi:MAG TPA: LTA synthase family protein [Staphylococcus saprophyticus]|nr:LTA synthase family protein [Staphylococcus saprophyticus]
MIKNFFKTFDWINFLKIILSIIFLFYINFYLVNSYILTGGTNQLPIPFQTSLTFGFVAYLFSIIGISFYLIKDLNKLFLIKVISGYLIYQVISYFLLVTRNLNNREFKTWDFANNHFFQTNFLPTFLIILGISIVLSFIIKKSKYLTFIENYLEKFDSKEVLLSGILSSFIVNDRQMLKIFKELVLSFLSNDDYVQFMTHLSSNLFLSLVIMGIISYLVLNSYQGIATNTPTPSVMVTVSLLLAIIFNYTLQLGVRSDEALLGNFIFPGATAYQIIVLTLLFLVIYLVLNRFLSATLFIIVVGVIISVVNNIKEGLRSEPLLITDFVWLKEISLLTSFVDKNVIIYIVLGVIVTLGVYILLRKRILPGKIFNIKRLRFSFLGALIGLGVFNFIVFRNETDAKIIDNIPVVSKVNNWFDINWMGFSTNASYKSLTYVWTKQLTKSVMETPDGYSEEKIKEIAEKYRNEASIINASRTNNIEDQTVIFILSESFSDPSRVPSVVLSQDAIPNISQIKNEYTSGLMLSDFYGGGGTANMEFQALSGLPYSNYSSSVSTIYTEVVPKMSYFPSISNEFSAENRIVLHPSAATNYSRLSVYKQLNFNKFIALSDSVDKFSNISYTGVYVNDATVYENVLKNIDVNGEGKFFSVITMQNHVPWNASEPKELVAYSEKLNDAENNTLTNYAHLLYQTDLETENFLEQLKEVNSKVTVVFYGDHLPGLYPQSIFSDNPESQYQTDYFIWSNYETSNLNYPIISSSDFPAELLLQTNSKVSPYYALLTNKLNGDGEAVEDLKFVQYDITLGKGYLKKNFFEIGK